MLISPFSKPSITPPAAHPRLMLTRKDLPRVRQNLADPDCALASELWQELLQQPILCQGATPEHGTYDLSEYLAIEAKALNALLTGNPEAARQVIEELLLLLRQSVYSDHVMNARWSGHMLFVSALVYDWCYDHLTEAEKDFIIATCEGYGERYFEMGYPPERQAALSGHGSESQLLRDLLAFGIAVYDERPDIYDYCAGRVLEEYVPVWNAMFAGEFHPQGPSYGGYRYACLMWAVLLLYAMSGKKVISAHVEAVADSFFYLTRPDGEALRLGDDFCELKAAYTRNAPFAVPLFFAAACTGNRRYYDGYLRGLDREYLVPTLRGRNYYTGGAYGEGLLSPTAVLIWNRLTPEQPAAPMLPYRYFGSPAGVTLWKDQRRLVLLKIGEYWGANHDHLDTGCFQVYCDGPLASDSGVYDSYGTEHRRFYTIRTGAHNCLTVSDPAKPDYGEYPAGTPYDGGTRRPCQGLEPKTLAAWLQDYKMAEVLSHEESSACCRIRGDLTEAYRHTCHRVLRDMCWEPEKGGFGTLTVHDRIEAKSPDFVTAFHIHCQSAPILDRNTATLSNGKSKLICRVLEPKNAQITAIGGAGQQFVTDGVNYEPNRKNGTEAGWGQVIITPAEQTAATEFLVEMELQEIF